MSVLVVGGAGYIGSHTVYALVEAGADVVVADNLSTGHLPAVHPKARFYRGDIGNRAFLDDLLQKERIKSAIHFAAYSLVDESMREPLKYYRNNLGGTASLLEAVVDHNVSKIVFSSTAAVYGEPELTPIREDARTQPANPYGETKLAMERMFEWTAKATGMRFVALRYFNAGGAHPDGLIGEDHSPETHLIPVVLQVALGRQKTLEIYGGDYPTPDGTCIRDYIHVCDLASAHVLALDYLERGGKSDVFNLGNGTGFSNLEVVNAARHITGATIPVKIKERRTGDPAVLVASGEKAGRVLGWRTEYPGLESIIETAFRWHKEHPSGYQER